MNEKCKQSVRFSGKNRIHMIERLNNPEDIYLSVEENSIFQQSLRSSIRKIREEGVNNTYFQNLIFLQSCCEFQGNKKSRDPPENIMKDLATRWSDRRGLEAYASKTMSEERIQQIKEITKAIIKTQRRLERQWGGLKSEDDRNSLLAKKAEKLTASAKVFASTMGQIDAISAKQ
mmetsp:Transcript_14301/g.16394  ORF Transcript_14301/g.16394 Transcript_14301/m.16394 type:complete len:175 (+) Transcript_14301:80-604(+)